jgi:hypothetical protein
VLAGSFFTRAWDRAGPTAARIACSTNSSIRAFRQDSLMPTFAVRDLQCKRQQVRRMLDTHLRLFWSADRDDEDEKHVCNVLHHFGTFSLSSFSFVAQNVPELHKPTSPSKAPRCPMHEPHQARASRNLGTSAQDC